MPATDASRVDRAKIAIPILIVVGVLCRLPHFGESLWLDEVLYSTRQSMPNLAGLRHFLLTNPGGPLYPAVAFFWAAVAGNREVLLRLPSLIFGVGSIVLTFFLGRRLGPRGTGFLAALILCLAPAHVWYTQEATPYAMTIFLLLAAIVARPVSTNAHVRWTRWALYTAALTGACLSHYFAAVFLLPLTLLALRAPRRTRLLVLLSHVIAVAVLAISLAVQYRHHALMSGMPFLRPFTAIQWWMLFFHWFLQGNAIWTVSPYQNSFAFLRREPAYVAVQLIAFALVLIGVSGRRRDPRPDTPAWELPLYLCVLPVAFLVATLCGLDHLYIERYAVSTIPFFAIALASGAMTLRSRSLRAIAATGVVALSAASYAMLLHKTDLWTVYKPNPDWASAARYVAARDPSSALRVVAAVPVDDFEFYLRKQMPGQRIEFVFSPHNHDPLWELPTDVEVVVVWNRYWPADTAAIIAAFAGEPQLRPITKQSFRGVDLYYFKRI